MAQYGCAGSLQVCALRGARLGADCVPVSGAANGFSTSALISLSVTQEIEEGEEFTSKNGCGEILQSVKDCDRIKRANLEMELGTYDFELVEILTGSTLLVDDDGVAIGIASRGPTRECQDPAYLEVYTKAVIGLDTCPAPSGGPVTPAVPGWFRWVFPKGFFRLGDFTLENGFANLTLTGYSETNSRLPVDGPFGDWNWDSDGLGNAVWDADWPFNVVATPNVPDTGCGYITVPASGVAVPPVAVNDTFVGLSDGDQVPILLNDIVGTDPLDPASVVISNIAPGLTAISLGNGYVSVDSAATPGTYTFDYTVSDTQGSVSNVATVTVTFP